MMLSASASSKRPYTLTDPPPMKHLLAFIAFLLAGFSVSPTQTHGQALPVDARLVHIINFQAGVVKAQWIPYGRRWAIQGTTMKVENEILAVVGHIDARGRRDRQTSCWTSPPDVYTDVFRLVFDPLDIGRRYDVSLDFYGAFDVRVLTPALDRAYRQTVNRARQTYPYVRQQEIRDIFIEQIDEQLGDIFSKEDVILLRNLTNGACEIVSEQDNSIPLIDFDSQLLNDIAEVVLSEVRTNRRSTRLDEIEDANRQLLENPQFSALKDRLREEELRDYGFLEFGDANILESAIDDNELPSEEVIARLYATGFACRTDESFPDEQCALLNDVVDRYDEYAREVKLASDGEEDYLPLRVRMLNDLGVLLSELYTPVANTRINAMQWDDAHSTSDRVRIGTSIGFGVAALNFTPNNLSNFEFNQAESFFMAAFKFYPFAVDKQLPSPYFGRELFARTSLLAGVLFRRNLTFENEPLDGAVGGIYPVLGGGFDLTKNITLQVGAVFFRQPSFVSNDNSSELKAAPTLSFAFDFDGINRLRDAFRDGGRTPYPQP